MLCERDTEICRCPTGPSLARSQISEWVPGRDRKAARNAQWWPSIASCEGNGGGSATDDHNRAAYGQARCERDRAYFFTGLAEGVELPEMVHGRCGAGQNFIDGWFGQENLGCNGIAEPLLIAIRIGPVG
jgi:hypothetical protein